MLAASKRADWLVASCVFCFFPRKSGLFEEREAAEETHSSWEVASTHEHSTDDVAADGAASSLAREGP